MNDISRISWIVGSLLSILGTMTFVVSAFNLIERTGLLRKFKIQNKPLSDDLFRMAMYWVSVNTLIILSGVTFAAFTPFYGYFSINMEEVNYFNAIWQIPLFFVAEDILFYGYHIAFHQIPSLYQYHKIHHLFKSPFPLASFAVHPLELMAQSMSSMMLPLVMRPHVVIWWMYLVLRNLSGIEDHLGYDIPYISLSHYFPNIFGGAKAHDDHHLYFNGNYGSFLIVLDKLMGTDL